MSGIRVCAPIIVLVSRCLCNLCTAATPVYNPFAWWCSAPAVGQQLLLYLLTAHTRWEQLTTGQHEVLCACRPVRASWGWDCDTGYSFGFLWVLWCFRVFAFATCSARRISCCRRAGRSTLQGCSRAALYNNAARRAAAQQCCMSLCLCFLLALPLSGMKQNCCTGRCAHVQEQGGVKKRRQEASYIAAEFVMFDAVCAFQCVLTAEASACVYVCACWRSSVS